MDSRFLFGRPWMNGLDQAEKDHFGRQLITEGLATYITAEVLGISDIEALWANYLSPEKSAQWLAECSDRVEELREYCRKQFEESDHSCEMFMANDPDDILRFRAGYYLGLELVREVAAQENLDLSALLKMERTEFERLVLRRL